MLKGQTRQKSRTERNGTTIVDKEMANRFEVLSQRVEAHTEQQAELLEQQMDRIQREWKSQLTGVQDAVRQMPSQSLRWGQTGIIVGILGMGILILLISVVR